MRKFLDFFSHLKNVVSFNQLDRSDRSLTIYSEGKNYWSYLGGLVDQILKHSDLTICYVTSSRDDPGLAIDNPRLKSFIIGEGFVRDWMFANMQTDVMVMTMPDLHQYQVKKSSFPVHYVYVQHSLVSFHMVYRPGAFDHYNTIFCAGPHHLKEMRAIEQTYELPEKRLFEHGYARLDSIRDEAKAKRSQIADKKTHYLMAPSWGPKGTIETGIGAKIADLLIANNARLTLRPHPQTIKFAEDKVMAIVNAYKDHPDFHYENNVQGQDSLHASDVMICDWSGAALDYAFGLGKPVLFIDVDRKINNPDYERVPITPFEVTIREQIGKVISPDALNDLLDFDAKPLPDGLVEDHVFNVGNSDRIGAMEIIRIVENLTAQKELS